MKNKIKEKLERMNKILMIIIFFEIFFCIIALPIFISFYLNSFIISILVHFLMYVPFFMSVEKVNQISDKLNILKSKKQKLIEQQKIEHTKEIKEHSKKRQNELLSEISESVAPVSFGILIGSFFF